MRVLLLDQNARAEIKKVKAFAESHPYLAEDIQHLLAGEMPPPGDLPEFRCEMQEGFKVVFSYEEQPCGVCRHLSVSVDSEDRVPSIDAVKLLMHEFGFEQELENCTVWLEDIPPSKVHKAVNVLEPINADDDGTTDSGE